LSVALAASAQPNPAAAPAVGRRALLIGNSAYRNLPPLANPAPNVQALAGALRMARFDPQVVTDVSQSQWTAAISKFLSTIEPGDFAFVYFSGYGYQEEDANYLVPVDFNPKDTDSSAGSRAYSLTLLLRQLDGKRAGTKMIVLDASRPCKGPAEQCKGLSEGLAQPQQPSVGTLIAFSAPPNQPTEDSAPGVNGFTAALVRAIEAPGSTPRGVLDAAQNDVGAEGKQLPFVLPTPVGPFYFIDPPKPVEVAPKTIIIEKKAELKPGQQTPNPTDLLIYNWIPGGEFQMGCVSADKDCKGDETPRHQVTITKGFWLTGTEVTVEAYSQFASKTGHPNAKPSQVNHGGLVTDTPVINVTWDDAKAYCAWAGQGGRLPTEAEWEYAARGGKPDVIYPFGDWDPAKINFFKTDKKAIKPYVETVPVHKFTATNGYGLYGIAGNAAEWVSDYYGPYTATNAIDPTGPPVGKDRVTRGGSWNDPQKYMRVSSRDAHPPEKPEITVGFRCVLPSLGQGN
jgi:formylglycine-generating enzyme required for sulfatase activity